MPEEVSGLPNVPGLESFVDAQPDKGAPAPENQPVQEQPQAQPQQTQQPPPTDEQPKELNFEQFKNPKDILKSYKEIQGFTTRVAQENKQLKEQLAAIQENVELMRLSQPPPAPVQQRPPQQAQNFDSMFIQNPQGAVSSVAAQTVRQEMAKARIAEVLDQEYSRNPTEYNDRFAYANQLSTQYPQLTASPMGIRKLFQMADKFRAADYQNKGRAFLHATFGEDIDLEKFKAAIKRDKEGNPQGNQINNAYMPDSSISSRSGPESEQKTSSESDIHAAVKKGDPDAVISAMFKGLGLRT